MAWPHPMTRLEIEHIMKPLLAQCDAAGRAYVIELARSLPGMDEAKPVWTADKIQSLQRTLAQVLGTIR